MGHRVGPEHSHHFCFLPVGGCGFAAVGGELQVSILQFVLNHDKMYKEFNLFLVFDI